jgi:hypothetical protein
MLKEHRLEIILVSVAVVLAAFYARSQYIPPFPERQVDVSEQRYHFDVGDPGPWFSAWSVGDGQAFVLIALDPTGRKLAEEVGIPTYRFVRAGYGWLGWVMSLGRAEWVPYALALVGALSIAATLALAIRLRGVLGPMAWILVLNPAIYVAFAGDTSEALGVFLLALTMASGWRIVAAALGFTRPTFAIALWGRWRLLIPALAAGLVLTVYGLVTFADKSLDPGDGLAVPLAAYFDHLSPWTALLAIGAVGTVAVGVRRRDWAWVVSGIFVLAFGNQVVSDPVNAWRAAGFLPVLWAFGPGFHTLALRRSGERTSSGT